LKIPQKVKTPSGLVLFSNWPTTRLNPAKSPLALGADRAHILGMRQDFDLDDYSVVVKHRADPPKPWKWEIYRAGRVSSIKRSSIFFQSVGAANLAGKEALARLLDKLK
jgi:hypothetical protein